MAARKSSDPAPLPIDKGASIESLEEELARVRTSQVVVPTDVLRRLLKNERLLRDQCKDISVQLEAIKSLDVKSESKSP
ncbi:MAG: hypothetical protein ACXWPM_02175 [Bdellovibrionota bacterium]